MRELPVIHRSRGLVCLSARAFIINRFDVSYKYIPIADLMDNTVVHLIHLVVRLSNDGKWAQLTAISLQPAVMFKAKKEIIVLYMIWNEVK